MPKLRDEVINKLIVALSDVLDLYAYVELSTEPEFAAKARTVLLAADTAREVGQAAMALPTYQIDVPTYTADTSPGEPEWSDTTTPVLVQYCEGVRLLLGTEDKDELAPDIQVERRLGGWAIFLHPVPGSDPAGFVYFLDDGRSFVQQESCEEAFRIQWLEQPDAGFPPELNKLQSHWDVDPEYPLEDWQHEVAEDNTRQSYKEWVAAQRKQKAEDARTGQTETSE